MANKAPGIQPFRLRERIRWSDIDSSGIILWSAYTRLVEIAETELFRAAGFPYDGIWERLDIWLPRVQFHIDYRSPLRLDDEVDVEIHVGRLGNASIRFELAFRKPDATLAAEGYLVIVAIRRQDAKPVAVPAALATALQPWTIRAA